MSRKKSAKERNSQRPKAWLRRILASTLFLLLTVIGLVSGLFGVSFKDLLEWLRPTLVITPAEVIQSGAWETITNVEVRNQKSEPTYNAYVKLFADKPLTQTRHILIEIPASDSSAFTAKAGNVLTVDYQVVEVFGSDEHKRESVYLIIGRIGPGRSRIFKVTIKPAPSVEQQVVKIKATYHSSEPVKLRLKEGKPAFPLKFHEEFTVKQAGMLLRRNR